ncbi:MAG: DUF5777 family beta-barrel protein [Cyclobacteriaceae bacterium]
MRLLVTAMFVLAMGAHSNAQDDLLKMLEEEAKPTTPDYATATFKTTRLINGHSIENVAPGVLDFRISHRFGFVNTGIQEFFGLDQAYMRLGFDYGINERWMVGVGRSNFQKQVDMFSKFKVLRQSTGLRKMPVTVSVMSSFIYNSSKFENPARENFYTSKMFFAHQVLIGRKFSESLSFQLMPTLVHYNLIQGTEIPNDLYSIGAGGRIKLSKRVSFNAEYYYQLPGNRLPDTYNSIALGFDIETGGHVFQLHFTNSTGMTERTYINETAGDFFNGDIHFGFNISRVFTIKDPRK